MAKLPLGHVVHIERLEGGHGVAIWLDGMRVKSLSEWTLAERHRPPSVLTLVINTDAIVWGAPEPEVAEPVPIVDDGLLHFVSVSQVIRRTPSGKYTCENCGEPWPCSTFGRRGASPPAVDKPSGAPLD